MPSATTVFTVLAGIVAVIAAAVYFIGIPTEYKRKMEEAALEKMGENKGMPSRSLPTLSSLFSRGASTLLFPFIFLSVSYEICFFNGSTLTGDFAAASYIVKDQISKLPASEQRDAKELQKGLGNALGGALQNPLGKETGNLGDKLSSPFTGR
ncbi:MAG: hypothetical protein M1821_009751 [Bathelium mastoideum]|nr:MAG: hypothetical protein M1821_009751 [Bathelium mastoideum]KAI9690491.1 MAG: hypothetical protein M1822_009454 [Bathelium mastoideum]